MDGRANPAGFGSCADNSFAGCLADDRADPALAVARYGIIDEFWRRQLEVCHDVLELFTSAVVPQPRVAGLLLRDGGNPPVVIVVARVNQAVVRQGKQFFGYAPVQHVRVAILKVSPSTSVNEKRIAGEYPVAAQVGEVPIGMSGCMQRLQRNTANAKGDAFLDANIRAGKPVESRRGNFAACGLLQFKRGSNMVRVDMRLDVQARVSPRRWSSAISRSRDVITGSISSACPVSSHPSR